MNIGIMDQNVAVVLNFILGLPGLGMAHGKLDGESEQ